MMGNSTSALAHSDLSLATRVQGQGGKAGKGQGADGGKGGFGDVLAGTRNGGAADLNRLAAQFRAEARSDGQAKNTVVDGDLDTDLSALLDTLSPDALQNLMDGGEPATPELGALRDALTALKARMAEAETVPDRSPMPAEKIPAAVLERLKEKLPAQAAPVRGEDAPQPEEEAAEPGVAPAETRTPRILDKRLQARDDTTTGENDTASADDALKLLGDRPVDPPMLPAQASERAHAATAGDAPGQGDGGGERRVRIVRADGKGGALELALDKNPDMPTDTDLKARPTGFETVTVLDSRRYLGLAPSSNATNVLSAMTGDHEWTAAMQPGAALQNAAAQASTGKVVNTLKIQMNPIELGLVTATMRVAGDELSIEIRVETGAAYRQLSDDQSGMIDTLRQQGFAVDKITVLYTPSDSGDQGASQQNGASGFGQAPARDGERGAGEGGNSRQAAREDRAGRDSGHEKVASETGIDGSGPRGRPTSVYL